MEKDIATASETENIDIDIATDSEMENVEAPVFGVENTIYYAITKNQTEEAMVTVYLSSTNLSTNTSIGDIKESGTVETYNSLGMRPWEYYGRKVRDIIILDEIKPTTMAYWFGQLVNVNYEGLDKINTSNVTDMNHLFYNGRALSSTNIEHIKNWDVSNVTNMTYMFSGYQGTTLDINGWNTSKVTDMSYMFQCNTEGSSYSAKLTSLDLSNWDTSSVTNMEQMFSGLQTLTSLDLSTWNTSNVVNMSSMFLACSKLGTNNGSLKLTGSFNTTSVTNMGQMFKDCTALTSLDLSSFNTTSVTNMSGMFRTCKALTSLDLSSFNTANVTNMSYMFYECYALTSLNVSSFNTKEVTNMCFMFGSCSALPELKLLRFNTSKVTDMTQMFVNCSKLVTIIVTINFVTTNVTSTSSANMFYGCTSIVGGSGTKYKSSKVDKSYARIDNGVYPDLGYFTEAPIFPVEILTIAGLPNPSGEGDHIWPVGDFTTLDLSNFAINVKYDNDSEKDVNYTGNELDFSFAPQPLATTSTSLVITYKNIKATVSDIFVYEQSYAKDITGIGGNVTTVYVPGDTFNPTGLELEVKTFGGATTTISYNDDTKDKFTFSPNPFLNPPETITETTTTITVQYGEYGGCTYDIPIIVTKRAQGVEIEGGIDQYYTVGDTFDITHIHNLVATATNADNTVEVIKYAEHPEYFSFTPNFGTALTVNDNKITIKIKGIEKDYPIVVEPVESELQSIAVVTGSVKTDYVENQLFDPTGLKITTTYTGNITRTIEYNEETKNNFTFSPNPFAATPEKLTYGIDKVTITYKVTKSCDLGVTVRLRQVATISQVTGLVGTAGSTAPAFIASGSNIDLTTLQVTIGYDNGEVETKGCDGNEVKFLPEGPANPKATYKIETRGYEKVLGQDIIFVYTTEDKKEITGVTKQPTTTVYIPGERFNPTGMEIQTKDFEGNTETIICTEDNKDDFTFEPDPIPNNATDPTDIIVRYKDYEECKTTITVKVTPPAASLEVGGRIDKYYTVGDTFEATNIHDLVATATNADNTVEVIKYADNPEYFSFTPAFGKVFSLADHNSTITLSIKGQTKDFDVVVLPATSELESIALVTGSAKTSYIENQLFDPTGLKITATYTGNATRTIEYAEETKNNFTFSPNPFAATPEKLVYGTDHVDITYNGKSTSVNVSVALRQVVDIKEVTGLPGQTATEPAFIKNGATIDLTNLQVKVEYNNGEEEIKSYNASSTEVQLLPTGPADATAVYKIKVRDYEEALDQSVIFVYTDEDKKEITGISNQPTTVYVPGEPFDPTGLEINTKDFEGNTETITFDDTVKDNFTFSPNPFAVPPEPIAEGTTTIKVQYGNYDKSTIEIPITLLAKASLLTVNDAAIDKYYRAGETFATTNIHNLVATVINTDATQETIKYTEHPEYFSFTPAIGTAFKANDTKITIKLRGVTCDYPIVVEPIENPTGATAGKLPTKTQYEDGEPFDPTGMIITVTYPGGVTRTIEYNDETKDDFTFSPNPFAVPPETLSSGNNQVEVKYRDKPFYVPVTIRKKMQSIAVKQGPTNKEYSVGDKFDPTGLVIEVTYTDTTTETIVYNSSTQSGFTFVPALDQAFTSTTDKVKVGFGTIAPIDIDGLVIHRESISITIVNSDGTTTVVTDVTRDEFEKKLDEAIAQGAIGFHEYTADGINDAQKKYNRYTPPTMNKEQALDKFDDYIASGTGKMFIGASFPTPAPAPSPAGRESGGSDGGGRSIISYDPQGNIQPGQQQQQEINKVNNIPQSNLVKNDALAETLKSIAENVNRPIINVKDESGDQGYGQWLHVPNTIIWMVMSGESTNTTKQEGNAGFLSNGWYNLSWKGRDEWYHFDKNGMMQLGWITENSKIYYLEEDLNSNWYGRRVTGPYTVKGVRYIFDQTGALIQ